MFRPPPAIMLLSASVGTGTQLLVMILVALVFACLGFLSPPNRGALMTAVLVSNRLNQSLVCYVVMTRKRDGGMVS